MKLYAVSDERSFRKQARLSLLAFLLLFPSFIISLVSALLTAKPITWVDAVGTLGDTIHAFIVFLVAHKMAKETGDKYNFGLDRLEVFMSFVCDVLISAGFVIILFSTVLDFFYPSEQSNSLVLFCLYKAVNVLVDFFLFCRQRALNRAHPSRLLETEIATYKNCTIGDLTVGLIAVICHVFREQPWVRFFSPAATILLISLLLINTAKHIGSSVAELSDMSIPVSEQDAIYDIVLQNERKIIRKIVDINCRRLNNRVYVDIVLQFNDDITFLAQKEYLADLREKIGKIIPDAAVRTVIE